MNHHYKTKLNLESGEILYISTNDTFDVGWETMVFDQTKEEEAWSDIFAVQHDSAFDAKMFHLLIAKMATKWCKSVKDFTDTIETGIRLDIAIK